MLSFKLFNRCLVVSKLTCTHAMLLVWLRLTLGSEVPDCEEKETSEIQFHLVR